MAALAQYLLLKTSEDTITAMEPMYVPPVVDVAMEHGGQYSSSYNFESKTAALLLLSPIGGL